MSLKYKTLAIALLLITGLNAQAQSPIKDTLSYSIGVLLGTQFNQGLKQSNTPVDIDVFMSAVGDVMRDKTALSLEQCQMIVSSFFENRANKQKEENLVKGNAFLENNKIQKGVVALPSGLQYKIIAKGKGKKPIATDEVEVNYKGTLIDGREFDSSYARNETATFPLNRVIKGWTEGLQQVDEGGKIILYIPPQLAYGENGQPGSIIEPNSTLVFEIELIKIIKKEPQGLIQPQPLLPTK